MDHIRSMQVFSRICEVRSFARVAGDFGLARSTVTEIVKQLEERLGTSLLYRTTRVVRPTQDGEAYYQRCAEILSRIDEADSAFATAVPQGILRIEVHGILARHFLLPALPDFRARYPDLDIHISEGDRLVDLVREGVDCSLRVGTPEDSDMIVRKVAELSEITCASPAYLAQYGTPHSLDDLDGHVMVGFRSSVRDSVIPLDFVLPDGRIDTRMLPAPIVVNGAETYAECGRKGMGLIQRPLYGAIDDINTGRMVEVLADTRPVPSPVSVLYRRDRHLSARVRVFIDWVVLVFAGAQDQT